MAIGGTFEDFLSGDWEQVRGFLQEHLQQMRIALNSQLGAAFTKDGNLTPDVIQGDASVPFQYVANTGDKHHPKWDKVNLDKGVSGRLAFIHLPAIAPSTLVGRGSTGSGDEQPISLDPSLTMSGTTLSVTGSAVTPSIARTFLLMGA